MLSIFYKIGLPIIAIGIIIGIIHHYDNLSNKLEEANQTISVQQGKLNDYKSLYNTQIKQTNALKTSLQEQQISSANSIDLLNSRLHSSKYSPIVSKKTTTPHNPNAKDITTANTRLMVYIQQLYPYALGCYHQLNNLQTWVETE